MSLEHTEEELSWIGLAAAGTLRVAELAAIALGVLIFCPPLMILIAVVVLPMLALGLVAALIALPVVMARHLHRRRPVTRALGKLGWSR